MHTQGRQGRWPREDRGGILLPGAKECPGLQRAPRAGGGKEGLSPEPAEGTRLGQPLYLGFLAPRIVRGYISIVLAAWFLELCRSRDRNEEYSASPQQVLWVPVCLFRATLEVTCRPVCAARL